MVRLDFAPEVTEVPIECDADARAIAALAGRAFGTHDGVATSRGSVLCGTNLRQIDAVATLLDKAPPVPTCR